MCALAACGETADEREESFGPGSAAPPVTAPWPDEPGEPTSTGELPQACGDGVLNPGETCDDGPDNGAYGRCDEACGGPGLHCGDGRVDGPEMCDDGNLDDSDACTSACVTAACGDKILQTLEACDDGQNGDPDDGCTDACAFPTCGDGLVQPSLAEQCDDGNAATEDGCELDCTLTTKTVFVTSEKLSGYFGGVLIADEVCRAAAGLAGLAGDYLAWLGDGVLEPSTRFTASEAAYVLVDGSVVARGFTDLIDGVLEHAINLDEFGVPVGQDQRVWTGTTAAGFSSIQHCEMWKGCGDKFACFGEAGSAWQTSSEWSAGGMFCNSKLPLYCVEQ